MKQTGKGKKRKGKNEELTFAERFFLDLAEAELYALLHKTIDELIDGFNSNGG